MGCFNSVQLLGIVTDDPILVIDDESKEVIKGSVFLTVVSPNRDNGLVKDEELIYSNPFIFSQDPQILESMTEWKKNDIVFIKGVITTLDAKRGVKCSCCGQKSFRDSEITLITPIFAESRFTGLTEKEALEIITERREVSNQVYLIGRLCKDVDDKVTKGSYRALKDILHFRDIAKYQLGISRKFFLRQDSPDNKADYPHIISVGERAVRDKTCLHKNSLVLIDGMIYTREYRRMEICPHCNEKFDWNYKTTEILSFATEYLDDYITPEEAERAAQEKKEAKLADISKILGTQV